jgi:hypothetical protein
MPTLTPEAKQLLATTIRGLRSRLLRDIQDEAERRYRLSIPLARAGLDEAHHRRRGRLEVWCEERIRASNPKNETERTAVRERLLLQAVKEAGATLINRLVLVRHLEALELARLQVVTGGWSSKGYREFRDFGPALLDDETEGYSTLLQLTFDDLVVDLPGLFGDVGLTRLFPVPPATLREVVTQLDAKALDSAWRDDTTLGWVYQYWNDPEREALDAKINDGGKIEGHEIASKTQMFTERYMVEWLLQNSLGFTWLCICKKNGWTPDADRVLPKLETRRATWRKKRDAGEVGLDVLMPVEGEIEQAWRYYVPQPIPTEAVAKAPESIRSLKLIDPACGSGHFLVIAFDLLVRMYREEARHRDVLVDDGEVAEAILANNLHGVDIDSRAIQIAAAALYLKARALSPAARPTQVNLVAPTLQLGSLADEDSSLVQLRTELKREVGIPEDLTRRLVSALAGVDHLGTLLKVDSAVNDALKSAELETERVPTTQRDLFNGATVQRVKLSLGEAKATVVGKLEQFLARHSASADLGLRLDSEQLASGVRFVRMVKEGGYDVVVGNPPYQGTSRLLDGGYVAQHYAEGKADLYAAFLLRALELTKEGGISALVTMRGWLFLGQFAQLRRRVISGVHLKGVADLGTGAFTARSMDDVITTTLVILLNSVASCSSFGLQAGPLADPRRDAGKPARRHAALVVEHGRHDFEPTQFRAISGEPIVYWWSQDLLKQYAKAKKLGELSPVRQGLITGNNMRFVRCPWEVSLGAIDTGRWAPYIKGAEGRAWLEPLESLVLWESNGLEIKNLTANGRIASRPQNEAFYFRRGVAFSMIGSRFAARAHRFPSVFGDKGSSAFVPSLAEAVCFMNRSVCRAVLESLNPSISFTVGDVVRLPVFPVSEASVIFSRLEAAFATHEQGREGSVEFRSPVPSEWRYAQAWAQDAVDRAEGQPLPSYEAELDPPAPESFISYAVGVALGRFKPAHDGSETLSSEALGDGILFASVEARDSLDSPACLLLHAIWKEHGARVGGADDIRGYLRTAFFAYHRQSYENRPIYLPVSSAKRSYVAFISIHRWQDDTLKVLLADHLVPERRRLEGELEDLRKARAQTLGKGEAEKRFAEVQKLFDELADFIGRVTQLAECGPTPTDSKTPQREVDAPFVMNLNDGVVVNSAALWPLLDPQWKDPKKWWKELACADGRKDYDWAHLAGRYFPTRVRNKCAVDPSMAVAHKCFWEMHPAKAYAWELRLQDEIRPGFTIDEPRSDHARAEFLQERTKEATEIHALEMKRRERKTTKADEGEAGLLFEQGEQEGEIASA